jgi:hypothetical protein
MGVWFTITSRRIRRKLFPTLVGMTGQAGTEQWAYQHFSLRHGRSVPAIQLFP